MKTQLKVVALSVLVAVATSTYAKESKTMYFGLGVVQSELESKSHAGYKTNNWKVLMGRRLNSNWSIEGQYIDFATVSIIVDGLVTPLDMSGNSLSLSGVYHFNLKANHSPFVRLGWHSWDSKATNPTTGVIVNGDGYDGFYSIGVDGKINETMKYRAEFERMKIDSEYLENIGVGLLVDF
jgi:hypothetical protein